MTHREIISLWPTRLVLAKDIGLANERRVNAWYWRGNIPPAYWKRLVRAAEQRGFGNVTLDELASAKDCVPV